MLHCFICHYRVPVVVLRSSLKPHQPMRALLSIHYSTVALGSSGTQWHAVLMSLRAEHRPKCMDERGNMSPLRYEEGTKPQSGCTSSKDRAGRLGSSIHQPGPKVTISGFCLTICFQYALYERFSAA
ncbi:hypothetical protein AOLI_G00011700 [Acnodon oligacanthus]